MSNGNFRGVRSTPPRHQINNILNNKSLLITDQTPNGGISTIYSPLPWSNTPTNEFYPFLSNYTSDDVNTNPQFITMPERSSIISGKVTGTIVAGNEGVVMYIALAEIIDEIAFDLQLIPGTIITIAPNQEYNIDLNLKNGIIDKSKSIGFDIVSGSVVSITTDILVNNLVFTQY